MGLILDLGNYFLYGKKMPSTSVSSREVDSYLRNGFILVVMPWNTAGVSGSNYITKILLKWN